MGQRTEPCGTPEETGILSEFELFSSTDWFLLSRKYLIQFRVFPPLFRKNGVLEAVFYKRYGPPSFLRIFSLLLKDLNFSLLFAKIKEDKVCLFTELHVLASSSTRMMSCVSQGLFSRNPCCNSKRMFWSVKCLEIPEATTCSSTLQRTHVREIGR